MTDGEGTALYSALAYHEILKTIRDEPAVNKKLGAVMRAFNERFPTEKHPGYGMLAKWVRMAGSHENLVELFWRISWPRKNLVGYVNGCLLRLPKKVDTNALNQAVNEEMERLGM